MSGEDDRYEHASLAERLGDIVGWFRAHPLGLVPVLLVAAGFFTQVVAPPRAAGPRDLRVGDCVFVRTSQANAIGPGARPIGEPSEVTQVLMAGAAEQASCSASHGHEVSGLVEGPEPPAGYPGEVQLEEFGGCAAAFTDYVGRTLDGSLYTTFAAVPTADDWATGIRRVVCLVARADGQWMMHAARGSRE